MPNANAPFPENSRRAADPVEIVVGFWDELGEAIGALDRKALTRLRLNVPQRIATLNAAAQARPQLKPVIQRVLTPMLQRAPAMIQAAASNAAKAAAVNRRVQDTADQLDTATHITPIQWDNLANAGADGVEVSAPHNGQPFRYLGMLCATSAAVGTRITKFSLASTNHIVTDNVRYTTTTPTGGGVDFAQFLGTNQLAASVPRYRWQPWGLKRSGVIRPDGKINLDVANRSGAGAYIYVGLMLQSTPCGEQASYLDGRGGVYKARSKAGQAFMKKLVRFSMF